MKNLFILFSVLVSVLLSSNISFAEEIKKEKTFKVNDKGFNMVTVNPTKPVAAVKPTPVVDSEGLIMITVKNEFDEEIKVKLDTNREYPIGKNETISLGTRKPGKYTLTVYNKKGEYVDNLTQNISNRNRFILNKDTVSNSGKIDEGLSTGQKVAIGAGAVGVAALGAALIGKAIMSGEDQSANQAQYIPPAQQQVAPQQQLAAQPAPQANPNNAFASGGKSIKVLNTAYDKVTFIVEGVDGNPIGSNWDIPKASSLKNPVPLVFSGQNILINQNQKVKAVLPTGIELVRNAFELDKDPFDGAYVWVVK